MTNGFHSLGNRPGSGRGLQWWPRPSRAARGERDLQPPSPASPPRCTGPWPEPGVHGSLGRASSWAHEMALSAPRLNGRCMGSSEEHRRLFCVTRPLISRATEMGRRYIFRRRDRFLPKRGAAFTFHSKSKGLEGGSSAYTLRKENKYLCFQNVKQFSSPQE